MEKKELRRKLPRYSINSWKTIGATDPANYGSVCMENFAAVENIIQVNIFLYNIDIVEGPIIGELARRSVGIYSNTDDSYVKVVTFAMTATSLLS